MQMILQKNFNWLVQEPCVIAIFFVLFYKYILESTCKQSINSHVKFVNKYFIASIHFQVTKKRTTLKKQQERMPALCCISHWHISFVVHKTGLYFQTKILAPVLSLLPHNPAMWFLLEILMIQDRLDRPTLAPSPYPS